MAKPKATENPTLNVRIPAELRRRILIAKANTDRSIQDLLTEWIEAGLAKVERDQSKAAGSDAPGNRK